MAEYIEREAAMTTPVLPKEYRKYQTDNLDDAYEQGWMDALDNLKNAPAVSVPQWISVKDRLPENYIDVIVFDAISRVMFPAAIGSSGEWEIPGFRADAFNFTHWMPLPKPPKGENDG